MQTDNEKQAGFQSVVLLFENSQQTLPSVVMSAPSPEIPLALELSLWRPAL